MDGVPARRFQDLLVWQKGHALVLRLYTFSSGFPAAERYGLTRQLREAAVSVPANIAEGFRRTTKAEKARFLNIAQGSLEESRYYLILAEDLGYGSDAEVNDLVDEVARLLDAYRRRILASSQ